MKTVEEYLDLAEEQARLSQTNGSGFFGNLPSQTRAQLAIAYATMAAAAKDT